MPAKAKDKGEFFLIGVCPHCKKLVIIDVSDYPSGGQECPFDGTMVEDFAYVSAPALSIIVRIIAEKVADS